MTSIDPDGSCGALLGLAVGDALGTTLEFSRPLAPAFPVLATATHREATRGDRAGPGGAILWTP